ncbi:MAG: helix-turn-helix domain-containing protein [Erysipelotrichaceae bacterium]|jgi:transcriptional regulator with XRE-family HTH domain|nr:helix-turn-helix domain-containing protein [Erysipelotrichaceae bacterium]
MEETFGQRLSRLRNEKHMSQEELAKEIGVEPNVISNWENDISSPDISLIISISNILRVSTDELLGKQQIKGESEEVKRSTRIMRALHIRLGKDNAAEEGVNIDAEDGEVNLHINKQKKQKSQSIIITIFQIIEGSLFLLALISYILMGIFWTENSMGWKMGWLVFFIPFIIVSTVNAVVSRKIHRFAYPLLVTFVYLLLGFLINGWGIYWFLFITIPAFYAIVSPIDHYFSKK